MTLYNLTRSWAIADKPHDACTSVMAFLCKSRASNVIRSIYCVCAY